MSTQQDIYAAGFENHPPMLNKDNYVPWSSRLLCYAKSKLNGKLIHNSIMNGPYVRRMIPEPGDPDREVPVAETFHEQTDNELSEKEVKQMEADDQSIQIILMGLPKDIYAVVDSCETAQEIWLRVQQMMKGSDIRIQDKNAKLFNEWEMFTSTDGESIESHYHRFLKAGESKYKTFRVKRIDVVDPIDTLNNIGSEKVIEIFTAMKQAQDIASNQGVQGLFTELLNRPRVASSSPSCCVDTNYKDIYYAIEEAQGIYRRGPGVLMHHPQPPHHGGYDGHSGFDSQFGLGGGYFYGPGYHSQFGRGGRYFDGPGYYRQQPHQGYSNWPQLQAITQPRPRRAQARSFQPS
ncbi:hypothetical protein Tco_0363406 [Tanacetum coccineum]